MSRTPNQLVNLIQPFQAPPAPPRQQGRNPLAAGGPAGTDTQALGVQSQLAQQELAQQQQQFEARQQQQQQQMQFQQEERERQRKFEERMAREIREAERERAELAYTRQAALQSGRADILAEITKKTQEVNQKIRKAEQRLGTFSALSSVLTDRTALKKFVKEASTITKSFSEAQSRKISEVSEQFRQNLQQVFRAEAQARQSDEGTPLGTPTIKADLDSILDAIPGQALGESVARNREKIKAVMKDLIELQRNANDPDRSMAEVGAIAGRLRNLRKDGVTNTQLAVIFQGFQDATEQFQKALQTGVGTTDAEAKRTALSKVLGDVSNLTDQEISALVDEMYRLSVIDDGINIYNDQRQRLAEEERQNRQQAQQQGVPEAQLPGMAGPPSLPTQVFSEEQNQALQDHIVDLARVIDIQEAQATFDEETLSEVPPELARRLRRALRARVEGTLGDIEAMAAEAGIDLPEEDLLGFVGQSKSDIQAQLEELRAQQGAIEVGGMESLAELMKQVSEIGVDEADGGEEGEEEPSEEEIGRALLNMIPQI